MLIEIYCLIQRAYILLLPTINVDIAWLELRCSDEILSKWERGLIDELNPPLNDCSTLLKETSPLRKARLIKPSLKHSKVETDDFELAQKCKSMVEAGKPQTWIIENILGCKGRNFAQGKQRFSELLQLAS